MDNTERDYDTDYALLFRYIRWNLGIMEARIGGCVTRAMNI